MKKLLAWIKSNVLTVVAATLLLASVVALTLIHLKGNALLGELEGREAQIARIERLFSTQVELPPEKPDGLARRKPVAVNQAAIDDLKRVYDRMSDEYSSIFVLAKQINQAQHLPMLDGLFPEPTDSFKPFDARERYREDLMLMLDEWSSTALGPRLNAGQPLGSDRIEDELEKLQRDFLNEFFPPRELAELSQEERDRLLQRKQAKLLEMLLAHAQSIHLYTQTDSNAPGFPFEIGAWSEPGLAPEITEVWEGQMGLWIQQDIAEAIARANRVSDPQSNVTNAPIKRLLKVEVIPGYVGITGRGAMADEVDFVSQLSNQTRSGDEPLPDDFGMSPTGRRSNDIYDVRHVRVNLIADAQRLPEFFDALSQVNFMSVLKIEFEQVDEYDALKQGYVYGPGDAVQVNMLLETLWLRDWTARLMPARIRETLGIKDQEQGQS